MRRLFIILAVVMAGLNGYAQTDNVVANATNPDPQSSTAPSPSEETSNIQVESSKFKVESSWQSQAAEPSATPNPLIGFLSYDSVLVAMPQYAAVEKEMAALRQAYNDELKRAEDDFNQKYEAFLDGRKDFPRTILLKRQTELQQLLQRNVEFKEKGRAELEQTRRDKLAPLHAQLKTAIAEVAIRYHLAVVVNTDANACPFLDPSMCIDISKEVKQQLSEHKK